MRRRRRGIGRAGAEGGGPAILRPGPAALLVVRPPVFFALFRPFSASLNHAS
jgi:hypothetical protein